MGLNIREIIPRKEIEISDLKGKILCVDAFNILYQFLTTIRQPDGTPLMDSKKRITSHLSGLFYRNTSLLSEGIKLIYVFDGKPNELKEKTTQIRKFVREKSEKKYKNAKQQGDIDLMKKYSGQLTRLDENILNESVELLEAMGIPVVFAPGEGEEQAAYLSKIKQNIYATVSQDYDSLLFGAPRLVRNLTVSRKKKSFSGWIEIKPEIIELEKVLNYLEINLEQLICIGILVGTDYNPKGIPGIGPKKALQLVKKHRHPALIFESLKEQIEALSEEDNFDWKEIFSLFKNPNVIEADFEFEKIKEEKIKKILVEEHDFSEERVQKQLDKLKESDKKNQQKGLDKWF